MGVDRGITDYTDVAKKAPFSDVRRRYILELLEGPQVHFQQGDRLLCNAEPAVCAYVLRSGWGCHQTRQPDGRRKIIRFIMGQDIVGLISLLAEVTGNPTSAATPTAHEVVALTPLVAYPIERESLERLIAHASDFCFGLLASHANDIIEVLADRIEGTARSTPPERLARFFLETWKRQMHHALANDGGFQLPIGNAVIGDALGLEPSRVARMIATFERVGIIARSPGAPNWISVLEPELLRRMANAHSTTTKCSQPMLDGVATDASA